jgi:SAM-dependent methyltransferase
LPGTGNLMAGTPSGDADYLLGDLVAAESWHFWFKSRRRLVVWALRAYSPSLHSLLEVGCGTGFVLGDLRRRFPEAMLVGCDRLFAALQGARERTSGVLFLQGDLHRLPIGRQFDAISALDVIEHLDDDRGALMELFGALKPGGALLVTVPQHQWLWSAVDEFSRHRRRYSRAGLLEKIRAAGFDVQRCTSFFAATLPMIAWARLRGDVPDPGSELHISRALNAVAAALLVPEWLLVLAGVSLPFGSSLVVVARRPLR